MYSNIVETIKEYECKGDFTYADVEDNAFALAEEELGISIPSQYLWFLKTYGHGGLNGIETLGVGKNKKLIFKDETLKYRTYGLPHNLIVIENCDEWVYCIDSLNGKVKMWSRDKEEAYEDGTISGTNELFIGKGYTQNYLGEKGYNEYIATNAAFTQDDIVSYQYLGKIKK